MSNRIKVVMVIVVVSFILFSLVKQIYQAIQSGQRLDDAADQVNQLQQQNMQLKSQLAQAESYDTIEEMARDKLDYAKPNEAVVIIPQSEIDKVEAIYRVVPPVVIPNWKGWLNLVRL